MARGNSPADCLSNTDFKGLFQQKDSHGATVGKYHSERVVGQTRLYRQSARTMRLHDVTLSRLFELCLRPLGLGDSFLEGVAQGSDWCTGANAILRYVGATGMMFSNPKDDQIWATLLIHSRITIPPEVLAFKHMRIHTYIPQKGRAALLESPGVPISPRIT